MGLGGTPTIFRRHNLIIKGPSQELLARIKTRGVARSCVRFSVTGLSVIELKP